MLSTREPHNNFSKNFSGNFDVQKVDNFKELMGKNCQTRNPYPSKLFLQYWKGNKDFFRRAITEGVHYKYIGPTRNAKGIFQAEIEVNK